MNWKHVKFVLRYFAFKLMSTEHEMNSFAYILWQSVMLYIVLLSDDHKILS